MLISRCVGNVFISEGSHICISAVSVVDVISQPLEEFSSWYELHILSSFLSDIRHYS